MAQTNLTLERWASFTKSQQILMIGSELERAKHRILNNNDNKDVHVNPCYERIFELIDLTLEDKKWKYGLKELLRSREVIGELYIQKVKDIKLNTIVYKAFISMNVGAFNALNP